MLLLRATTVTPSLSHVFSPSKHLFLPFSFNFSPAKFTTRKMSTTAASAAKQTIEHIVLFKVKEDTEPSKVNAMVSGLNGLISLDHVLHLTAGPVLRSRSSSLNFTHMLHSRYSTKDDLSAYSAHPAHLSVVRQSVLPICDDIMAVDWVAEDLTGPVAPPPGSAFRVTFLKLKENLGDEVKEEILGVMKGMKEKFGQIVQLSCGENFSPARAKGFSTASLAVFGGVSEMEAVVSNEELVNLEKDKVRDYLEGVVVVDYVIPSAPQSATL